MPNTREKLIELLRKTRHEYRRYIAMKDYEKRIAKTDEEFLAVDDSIVGEIPFCADYLIANGVTVQEMDVVEVVRCKDCVYFRPAEDWNGKKYNACYLKPNVCIFEKKMEDFCSCGERRLPQPPKGE